MGARGVSGAGAAGGGGGGNRGGYPGAGHSRPSRLAEAPPRPTSRGCGRPTSVSGLLMPGVPCKGEEE